MKRYISANTDEWAALIQSLESDLDDIYDPLYEMTDAGERITEICQEIEKKLHLYLEPSIQAGRGGMWIYDTEDDTTLTKRIDYADFNSDVIDIALDSSSKEEFMKRYEEYLEEVLQEFSAS